MNNIEIQNIKGLEAGMTSTEINKLKKGKSIKKPEPEVIIEKKKILPAPAIKVEDKVIDLLNLNLKRDPEDDRDFKLTTVEKKYELKRYIDFTSGMSPVKNQGELGSCVAFAATAMKEWQEQIEHKREVKAGKKYTREEDNYDLSEAWIYWNCKSIDPWPNEEGTSIKYAMKVLSKIGVPCEEAYPYNDKFKGEPKSWAKLISKWGLIDTYYRCDTLIDVKKSLVAYGPMVIGIPCFEEIFTVGSNGIISYPRNPNACYGGHAICVVGYNDSKQLLKFKNSWGVNWGNKGYGYLPYRYINDFLWDAWGCKDLRVTKKIIQERGKDTL